MCRIERTGSLVLLFAHAAGRMPTLPVSSAYINPHGRPRRIDNRNFIASNNHEQPFRGESLFARTGPAGQALSPLYPEGKGDLGESGGAPLQVKRGRGSFRKSRSSSSG